MKINGRKDIITMTMVIAGFPGVGKTTATKLLKEKGIIVLDSDSSKFDKQHFPANYIEHIKTALAEIKQILFLYPHMQKCFLLYKKLI